MWREGGEHQVPVRDNKKDAARLAAPKAWPAQDVANRVYGPPRATSFGGKSRSRSRTQGEAVPKDPPKSRIEQH